MTTPLKKARSHRGLLQKEVALRVGITQAFYARIESGDPCSPDTAEKLARLFRRSRLTELMVLYPRRRCFRSFRPA